MDSAAICACREPERQGVLGVGVSVVDVPEAAQTIGRWIAQKHQTYVCVANTHLIMECQRDPELKRIHNEAGMVTPDGMPLVWASRLAGQKRIRRVYGPDLLLAVCEALIPQGSRHYFYGGAEGVPERLVERLRRRFPELNVAGTCSPPFRTLSAEEDRQMIAQINRTEPDIVWVGLGAPKQERWMARHRGELSAPVLIGVGAAFDFHAGVKRQAPRWMQCSGLEWAFRLACEPRRLWKRYAVNNPLFVAYLLCQAMGYPIAGEVSEGGVRAR